MTEKREGRILIVDDQRDIARVLKTSLELLNQGYLVVDVISGEEALLEAQRKEFDILVTDFLLPGMRGTELIQKIHKRSRDIRALIITGTAIADVKKDLREMGIETVFGIFEKPIDINKFTGAITKALHQSVKVEAAPPQGTGPLGVIPGFDKNAVTNELSALMHDLGAAAAVFVDRKGTLLLKQGQLDQSLRFTELAVLLAGNFTTTAEIAGYLGDAPPSAIHYYDGPNHDIYALSVGMHFFLALIFPGGSSKQMGPVLRYGKATVQTLFNILGPEALATSPARAPAPAAEAPPPMPAAPEVAYPEQEQVAEPAMPVAEEQQYAEEPVMQAEVTPDIHIDMESLDAELAGAGEVELFWDESAIDGSAPIEDVVSGEEAMKLGLLSDEEQQS